jgi:hypothetical protein
MDFSGAIQAHANWKLRLLSYCQGVLREKLDLRMLERDNVCELGKWLHGEARKYSADPMLRELTDAHAAFHRCAASMAALVERGQAGTAEAFLNSKDSDFCRLSIKVVGFLMKMREKYPA